MITEKTFSCLIVDDEPRAREILKRYIEQVPMLHLIGESSNAIQALAILKINTIDLLFLDVQMPQLTGLELIKLLKNPPAIILTTAFEKYALKAFDLDVADYLLKPIHFDRFLKAIMKALPTEMAPLKEAGQSDSTIPNPNFLYFRAERKMVKVFTKDILYIESLKDYVKIFTAHGLVITKYSITALEVMLPEDAFVRAHRSYIIALDKITCFTSDSIEINKIHIPIGKLYKQKLLKMMNSSV
jgi:DNA-binding LytR/AlgR family response regulator